MTGYLKKHFIRNFAAFLLSTIIILTPVTVNAACPITVSASQAQSDSVCGYYNLLPDEIRTTFENGGWTIEIEPLQEIYRDIGGIPIGPSGYSLAGITIVKTKKICLNSASNYSTQAINHEMGHYFDYLLYTLSGSQPSTAPDFVSVYQTESVGGDRYITSTSTEFFADAFKKYTESPQILQQSEPQTYNYVRTLITNYIAAIDAASAVQTASATVSGASLPEKTYPAGTFVYNGLDFGSVFNPEYYYNHYPDLQKAIGYDPQKLFRHFIQYGFAEGRTAIG